MRTDLELLKNAIDIHVHSSPDLYRRISDHFEVARAARDAGFRALVIKSHNFGTAARALMVQKEIDGIDVFGSLVLNLATGGLNPVAVETAIKYGAKQIYLPTVDSANHASLTGGEIGQHGKGLVVAGGWSEYTRTRPRLHLLDDTGQLKPDVQQILRLVGPQTVLIPSDCGHLHTPPVVEGIRLTIQLLLEEGFAEHEIRTLVHDNAAKLLYE